MMKRGLAKKHELEYLVQRVNRHIPGRWLTKIRVKIDATRNAEHDY
jgi:hypothetical protein